MFGKSLPCVWWFFLSAIWPTPHFGGSHMTHFFIFSSIQHFCGCTNSKGYNSSLGMKFKGALSRSSQTSKTLSVQWPAGLISSFNTSPNIIFWKSSYENRHMYYLGPKSIKLLYSIMNIIAQYPCLCRQRPTNWLNFIGYIEYIASNLQSWIGSMSWR
jgi:hypothetical protein